MTMDMTLTTAARSDQINAADLIGNTRTITIKEVRIKAGEDQPVTILIEGDKKAFRPCLGVRRLMVRVWGPDASKYIGESMTLFCDPKVTWAGKEEGGIRVSNMTGLEEEIVEYMRISRTATKPYKIKPLKMEQRQQRQPDPNAAANWANEHIARLGQIDTPEALAAHIEAGAKSVAKLEATRPDLHTKVMEAYEIRRDMLTPLDGKPESETGEGFTGAEDSEGGF
jgi:hypothetical protein